MNNQNDNQTNPPTSDQDVLNQYASSVKPNTEEVPPKTIPPQDLDDNKDNSLEVKMSEAPKTTPLLDPPFVAEPQPSGKPLDSVPPQSTEATNPGVKESIKEFNSTPIDSPTPASLSDNLESSKSPIEESLSVIENEPELTPEPEVKLEPEPQPEPKIELTPEPEPEPEPESKFEPIIQTETNSLTTPQEDPEIIKQKIEEVLSYSTASIANPPSDKPKTSGFLKTLFTLSLIIFLAIVGALGYFYINPFSKNNSETRTTPTNTPTQTTVPTQTGVVCELNGFIYNQNQSFPSADGCNTCTCVSADKVTCTDKPCSDTATTPATQSAAKSTITPTSSNIPKDWKTFSSTELGLSFSYPISWGEAEILKEDYTNRTTDGALDGKYYGIHFKNHGAVTGYTKNYSNYISTDYVGDKTNLDAPDTYSTKTGNIYFTKKTTVANQKTSIKTLLEYLPEASGAEIYSRTYLNGKTEYAGIEITMYYPTLNKIIEPLYKSVGSNEVLEKEAIELINSLKENTSVDKEAKISFDQYQAWLKTFKQI